MAQSDIARKGTPMIPENEQWKLGVSYRAPGCEKAVANAIRRDVRLMQGVQSIRELPRCEYAVALQHVRIWDNYKTMKAIKGKA